MIHFSALLLILLQNSLEEADLIVEKLVIYSSPCNATKGEYTYGIQGHFSQSIYGVPY